MKGLIIKSPHIEKILSGQKTWEIRSSNCRYRGPIALIKSGTKEIVGTCTVASVEGPLTFYRAMSGEVQSVGRTAGEALDALTSQLNEEEAGTLVIVQNMHPDRFFSALQQQRLEHLMARWRTARDTGAMLAPEEQTELEILVETELQAAPQRTQAALTNSRN